MPHGTLFLLSRENYKSPPPRPQVPSASCRGVRAAPAPPPPPAAFCECERVNSHPPTAVVSWQPRSRPPETTPKLRNHKANKVNVPPSITRHIPAMSRKACPRIHQKSASSATTASQLPIHLPICTGVPAVVPETIFQLRTRRHAAFSLLQIHVFHPTLQNHHFTMLCCVFNTPRTLPDVRGYPRSFHAHIRSVVRLQTGPWADNGQKGALTLQLTRNTQNHRNRAQTVKIDQKCSKLRKITRKC